MFFDLCYKTEGCNVGKSQLRHTYVNRNRYYFNHSEEGKKMLYNEPESKSYEFFESSVI